MNILINLEVVTAYNLKGLHNLFDKVETQVLGLKSLGVPSSTYGSFLSSILMTKLLHDLRLLVSRRVPDDDWDLDSLMRILDEEIGARERAATMLTPHPIYRRQGKDSATAAVLMTGDSSFHGCAYCGQDHPSSLCRTVQTPIRVSRFCGSLVGALCALENTILGGTVNLTRSVLFVMANIIQVFAKRGFQGQGTLGTYRHKPHQYLLQPARMLLQSLKGPLLSHLCPHKPIQHACVTTSGLQYFFRLHELWSFGLIDQNFLLRLEFFLTVAANGHT